MDALNRNIVPDQPMDSDEECDFTDHAPQIIDADMDTEKDSQIFATILKHVP